MQEVGNWMEEGRDENYCTLQQREFKNKQAIWEKKSNIVVHKYIDDLAKKQKNIELNDLDEENEEARKEVYREICTNIADKIEVQDDDKEEENEHIKMYEDNENNSSHKNEDGDKIYCISIALIFIIF